MKRQMWKKILDFLMSAAVWVDKLGSFLLEGNILFSFNKVIPMLDFFNQGAFFSSVPITLSTACTQAVGKASTHM